MILPIIKYPNPILRAKALKVTEFNVDLIEIVADMFETMRAKHGVGLAAPQIGISQCIITMCPSGINLSYFINPEIIELGNSIEYEEGCLSFEGIYELVPSVDRIKIKYQDLHGKYYENEYRGFEAVILHHEIQHLQGQLFIDRMDQKTARKVKVQVMKNK